MTLEPHLRRAMAPLDPDDGFADRVLERIEGERVAWASRPAPAPRMTNRRHWSRVGLALAASMLVAVAGSSGWLQHQRRVEGERTRAQLIEALKVTRTSLASVERKLARHSGSAGL